MKMFIAAGVLSMLLVRLGLQRVELHEQSRASTVSSSKPSRTAAHQYFRIRTNLVEFPQQSKPDCDAVYPPPGDFQNWTNCKQIGASACGGPDQCECLSSQRLVSFQCDQGTYQQCFGEAGNGCQ